ncbi:unnamed protein product, partial [Polarella glacialis]
LYDDIVDSGHPKLLHEHEKKVLSCHGSFQILTFLGHLTVLGAAAEIACQCRDRVGHGFAPKIVLDHTSKAIQGLRHLQAPVFPGLNSLRAHLHVSRAQAGLELERWEEAKQDATAALDYDPAFREAQYMLKSAEDQEW